MSEEFKTMEEKKLEEAVNAGTEAVKEEVTEDKPETPAADEPAAQ